MLIAEDHTRHPIVRRQLGTLRAAGHVLTILDQGQADQRVANLNYDVVHIRPVSLRWLGKPVWIVLRRLLADSGEAWWTFIHILQILLTGLAYTRRALAVHADWYQAHDIDTLLPALIAGCLRRRPVVYDAHEIVSEQGDPRSMRKRFERILERILIPRVDQLVVPSRARAQVYEERYGLGRSPLVVLNCPPSFNVSRSDLLRRRLGLAAGTRVVLYHGTLMPGRALEHLLLAAKDFDSGTVLVIIGEQTAFYDDVLRPLYEANPLAGRVYFLPFIPPEQMMQYVASADLGVVIYRNINLNNYLCAPTKLYEFVMAGVPVVVSDFPELLGFLNQFPAGRAFDPEHPASIAAAVNAYFRSNEVERALCTDALRRARNTFTWERESQKLLHLFARSVAASA